MEALSFLLRKAREGGSILGFNQEGGLEKKWRFLTSCLLTISFYFYFYFFYLCPDQLAYMIWVLVWFEACLGLKNSLNESELIPIG